MSMRYAQGHVFSNLGFAYGQLGELEKSQEHFTHAVQAAKDCSDFRGQWQAYEGLSAIHFHKKDYEKAVDCLKTALAVLPRCGVSIGDIQERIVAKLSNALEYQLNVKQTNKLSSKKQQNVVGEEGLAKVENRKIKVQVDTHVGVGGSLQDNDKLLHNNDRSLQDHPKESSPKVGHVRPRERNHKFIARGLHIDEASSDNEHSDASDSTFDTISSYSGRASSTMQDDRNEAETAHQLSNLDSTVGSATIPPAKKDPLNNTYEEPQDIIHVIETGRLRLHDLPPGPRDTVLASMSENLESQRQKTFNEQNENSGKKKSTICVIQ